MDPISNRKNDHLDLCINEDVESSLSLSDHRPFSKWDLIPVGAPELKLTEVDTTAQFLEQTFSGPFLITGMTGGVALGREINFALADAASQMKIPMGLGSIKPILEDESTISSFDVKAKYPHLFLIGNLGLNAFNYGVKVETLIKLAEKLKLNAFAFHLNPLQESIQPEGETDFKGCLNHLERAVEKLKIPVIIKEVGMGISADLFVRLVDCGVAAVDLGGKGGTSWAYIEGLRGTNQNMEHAGRLGDTFRNFGISTDQSLMECLQEKRRLRVTTEMIATGGIRDGLQVAKAISLGASMCGIGLPLVRAAASPSDGQSRTDSVKSELRFFKKSLEIAMFCSGARNLSQLSQRARPAVRN